LSTQQWGCHARNIAQLLPLFAEPDALFQADPIDVLVPIDVLRNSPRQLGGQNSEPPSPHLGTQPALAHQRLSALSWLLSTYSGWHGSNRHRRFCSGRISASPCRLASAAPPQAARQQLSSPAQSFALLPPLMRHAQQPCLAGSLQKDRWRPRPDSLLTPQPEEFSLFTPFASSCCCAPVSQ
jgi:hypothetical protein